MPTIPDDVRTNLEARTQRAFRGFIALGLILAPLTIGMSLFWVVWAFIHRKQAMWLLECGELIKAKPTHARRAADDAMPYEAAQAINLMGHGRARIFMKALKFLGRIVPTMMVGCELEVDGRRKSCSKYIFSNERIDVDENDQAQMLVNPKCPTVHGWIVSHIPEQDRGILPGAMKGQGTALATSSRPESASPEAGKSAESHEQAEQRKAA